MFFFSFARQLEDNTPFGEEGVGSSTGQTQQRLRLCQQQSCCRSRLSLGNRLLIHAPACAVLVRKEKSLDCE